MPCSEKRPRGRPRKAEGVAKRPTLTVRLRPTIREAVEARAQANAHSLSEEVEHLLEAAIAGEGMTSLLQQLASEVSRAVALLEERGKGEP